MKKRMLEYTRSQTESERGNATVAALVAVTVVFILCMGFLQLTQATMGRQEHAADVKNAFYLAEAGLAEAYCGLAIAKTGNVGTPAQPAAIGDGLFWVEAEEIEDGLVELRSTALHGRGRVSLGLVARRVFTSPSDLGVFVSDDVSVNPDTLFDSYDSSQGTYGEQLLAGVNNDQAILGSNGDITLSNGVVVNGDLVYGAGASASIPGGASVTGTVSAAAAPNPLPPVEVPDIPLGPGVTADDPASVYVVPPGEHGFDSFTCALKSRAVLTGPATLVFGSLSTKTDSLLTLDTRNGPIDIYILDDLDLGAGSSMITVNSRPEEVTVQIAGAGKTAAHLGAKSKFHGVIYSPERDLKVSAQFEVFGGLVAKSLNLAALGKLHMDLFDGRSRRDVLPPMWSWRVVDIPGSIASKGADPFRVLGVERSALSAPADSHEDQWLVITYVDLTGTVRTYAGLESGFDWSAVSEVVSAMRDGKLFQPVPEPVGSSRSDPNDPNDPDDPDDPPLTADEQALLDLINSNLTSLALRKELLANTPLTDPVLSAAITTDPAPMKSPDLKQVLQRNSPLSERILLEAILEPDFGAGELKYVLLDNSPLSTAALEAALIREPPLSATDLNEVLAAQ